MSLLFIEKVTNNQPEFISGVKAIARKYRMNPNWIMALMNSETGGTFSPNQYNLAGSGAVGLIQFMPSTAATLGTSTSQLASMTNVQQLEWVDKYIGYTMGYLGISSIKDYDDLYLLIFYPVAIGKPNEWSFPSSVYSQNKGIDINNDGIITISDFKEWVRKKIPSERLHEFTTRYRYGRYILFAASVLLVIGVLWYAWSKEWI